MPRRARVFVSGATYHVYSRVARGERVFSDPGEAYRGTRYHYLTLLW